jgi:hypothetical protein
MNVGPDEHKKSMNECHFPIVMIIVYNYVYIYNFLV